MPTRKSPKSFLEFALKSRSSRGYFNCINKDTENSPAVTSNGYMLLLDYKNDYEVGRTAYKDYRLPDSPYPDVTYLYSEHCQKSKSVISVNTETLLWAVKTAQIFAEDTFDNCAINLAIRTNRDGTGVMVVTGENEYGNVETPVDIYVSSSTWAYLNHQIRINASYLSHALSHMTHKEDVLIRFGNTSNNAVIVGYAQDREALIMPIDKLDMYSDGVLDSFLNIPRMTATAYKAMVKSKRKAKNAQPKNVNLVRPNSKPKLTNVKHIKERRDYSRVYYRQYDDKFLVDATQRDLGYIVPVERYHINNQ